MGLLDAFVQYVRDAMPGGLLNPEVGAHLQKTGDNIVAGHRRQDNVRKGLLADPMNRELQKQAIRDGMDLAGMAPVGMVAWHGSPHKFDKFSLDKIGTGEGAQAYGHGLYLAENPEVAKSYRESLTPWGAVEYNGKQLTDLDDSTRIAATYIKKELDNGAPSADWAKTVAAKKLAMKGDKSSADVALGLDVKSIKDAEGALYKTDIPDEAVARFLDWDKPLSQQAPEVIDSVKKALKAQKRSDADIAWLMDKPANQVENFLMPSGNRAQASTNLQQAGIPGIRYLDGGSRSAGQGSSNFVVFDPEMIRILERNGQPTGLQPWAPGEWRGLLSP